MAYADGYSMAFHFNLDGLGLTYISVAIAWTLILLPGAAFLIKNRHLPFLRIRNIPLAISAVATLHVYWLLCMVAYVLNGFFPCATEYWIMSIYLPLGIALFHASNTQLLYIAEAQKRYTTAEIRDDKPQTSSRPRGWRAAVEKVRSYSITKKTMTYIGLGIVLQFFCTLIIFLLSRRFHPSFGVEGHEVNMLVCRRGWEWWPSIVWQLFWAWIYAPYLLWRVRNISDVHGWRTQTVLCSLAGLPASPMWLCALYLHGMAPVSHYFVPPLWFSPSIVLMQGFTIFGPCFQVWKNHRLTTNTRKIIAEWEDKQKYGGSIGSGSTKVTFHSGFSHKSSALSASSHRHPELYTMSGLDKALQTNSTRLLHFAAEKDFSGENISFLDHVREWKAKWISVSPRIGFSRNHESITIDEVVLRRKQFNHAVEIYSSFVSLHYSNFPINISSAHLKELEALFDGPASTVSQDLANDAVTPFDNYWSSTIDDVENAPGKDGVSITSTVVGTGSTDEFLTSPEKKHLSQLQNFKMTDLRDKLPTSIIIPESFGPGSFDNAEKSIKELVLTNTWPKFVNAGYANSLEQHSIKARLAQYIKHCNPMAK